MAASFRSGDPDLVPFARARRDGLCRRRLSPGDGFYDEPYFYLSIYPRPDPSALPPLPPLGHWRLEGFAGAVAAAKAILASGRPEADLDEFLAVAFEAALALGR